MALITFLIYYKYSSDTALESSRVFSALALFNQLTVALFIFPMTVPVIIAAITSTRRLTKFLNLPELEKRSKGAQTIARVLSRSDNSLDVYENELQPEEKQMSCKDITENECSNQEKLSETEQGLLSKETPKSSPNCPKKRPSTTRKIERTRVRPRPSILIRNSVSLHPDLPSTIPDSLIVRIRDGIFSWDRQKSDNNLNIQNLEIPKGKLVRSVKCYLYLCCG